MKFIKRLSLEEKLIRAVLDCNIFKVSFLLGEGVNVNYKDKLGYTPLMYAVSNGFYFITKMLIEAGSNIEETNERGFTALALAKFNGNLEIYNVLKEENANQSIIENLRFANTTLEPGKKYSYVDIIQREIYCESDLAKKVVASVLKNIEEYKDFRTELIMTCIALYTLEKNETGNNLQIFVVHGIDSAFDKDKLGYLVGTYNVFKNIIQISNFGGDFVVTKTFLHEFVHKIHLSCKDLKLKSLSDAYNEVIRSIEECPKNQGSDYIKNNLVNRVHVISNNHKAYKIPSQKLLEYLADSISYTIIYKKYKDDVEMIKTMQYILEPIYNVFDNEISNQLKEYILGNKNFNMLCVSDSIKKSLREYKNNKRKQTDIIVEPTKENNSPSINQML